MATQPSTIDYILDQLSEIPDIRARKMFGEYALYNNGKVVALVCDDTLFIKITEEGKVFAGDRYEEGSAYPGSKPWMRVDMDTAEDRSWLCELIRITEEVLPEPKQKQKKKTPR